VRKLRIVCVLLACVSALLPSASPVVFADETSSASTALRDYVLRADDSYGWVVRQRTTLGGCEVVELTLTSQVWRGLVWRHRVFVVVPPGLEGQTDALLVVEGGSWKDSDAEPLPEGGKPLPRQAILLGGFAQQLGAPVVVVLNVPRQPIFDGRKEDAIIALTFEEFLNSGEMDWPLLLPMVKSVVRAMDAAQAFAEKELPFTIDRFTVTGASKRGWTTWLTAAVDERVAGIGPMVIDMLNLEAQLEHQRAAYGTFSERIHDYTDRDLPRRMRAPEGAGLLQIVDPYSYRDQITQPKMLFLGTNDGFWTLDSLNLYWDGLQGDKYVVYVPNADHDLAMDWRRVLGGLRALHRHAHGVERLPALQWQYTQEDQQVTLQITPAAADVSVVLWTAQSPTRDFRKAQWTSRPLTLDPDTQTATAQVQAPEQGYSAMYGEVIYSGGLLPLHLSTTIRVLEGQGR